MSTFNIIIADPAKSLYAEILKNIIENRNGYKVTIIKNLSKNNEISNLKPNLIIIMLDKLYPDKINEFLNTIPTSFETIPKIGIIHSKSSCDRCHKLKDKLSAVLTIPFSEADILYYIERVLYPDYALNLPSLQKIVKDETQKELLKGQSNLIALIREKIKQVAQYDVNVLLSGETGTGKELCARMIHLLGKRSKEPFVAVNCGAIPVELFENEFFGHKKGAFTNANATEAGLISAAEGGTLFFDEVESLSGPVQAKLLRYIEEKKYRPLGQTEFVTSNVRIIAAVKTDLQLKIQNKLFREDLYYRLNVVELKLPSLNERKEDIPLLVNHFIEKFSVLYNKSIKGIKNNVIEKLFYYDWPGNIRELENIIKEAIVTTKNDWIELEDINNAKFTNSDKFTTHTFNQSKLKAIETFEKTYLCNALNIFKGNVKRAAQFAQKDRRVFYNLMQKHHIDPTLFRH